MYFFASVRRLAGSFLRFSRYFFTAGHWGGYGLHSPFMFRFYKRVIAASCRKPLQRVLKREARLRRDRRVVYCKQTYGAGSRRLNSRGDRLDRIVKASSVSYKYGKILYAAARAFEPASILELGSSVGISTMYMAEGAPQASLYTVEGCDDKLQIVRENATLLNHSNVYPVKGEFSRVLPHLLPDIAPLGMVYIDGDHRKKQTVEYFNLIVEYLHPRGVLIIDDIHWSGDMTAAWGIIRKHPRVRVSVDLFRMGILLFSRELSEERFVIRY